MVYDGSHGMGAFCHHATRHQTPMSRTDFQVLLAAPGAPQLLLCVCTNSLVPRTVQTRQRCQGTPRAITIILEQNCAYQLFNHIHCFCTSTRLFFHQHSRTMSSIATDEHSPEAFIQRHLDELQRTGTGDKASFIEAARARRAQQPELWTKEVRILCGRYLATLKRLDRLAQRREPDIARAGHLYRWGTIDLEQEGDMNDDIHRMGCFSTFQPLQPSIIFLRVACGGSFMMASTPGGALFVLGNNAFGQLAMPGNKNYPTLTEHATMRFDDPEEHNIFCGYSFSFVRNRSQIFAAGCGDDGRLGNGSTEDVDSFQLVKWTMSDIACGSVSCTGIDPDGKLFSWGKKEYTGTRVRANILFPVPIVPLHRFHSVSCGTGGYHFLAVTRAGQLYAWGHNRVGQLGRDYDIDKYLQCLPEPVDFGTDLVVDAKAGWGHSIVRLENGSVWTCGRNHQGQLGKDPATCQKNSRGHHMSPVFERVDVPPVRDMSLGGETTTVTTEDGEVYWWGFCPATPPQLSALRPTFVPRRVHLPGTAVPHVLVVCGVCDFD